MQLYSYLCDNNLLSQKQFGFRLNSSTATASAMFTDKILSAMVFIDLTKAFDTVDHSILLLCSYAVLVFRLPPLLTTGLSLTCPIDVKLQSATAHSLVQKPFKLVYPKAPFWVSYCLRCTSTTYQIIWNTLK